MCRVESYFLENEEEISGGFGNGIFFVGLLLLLNFWTCFTTERAAFNRDIYPSPKQFSLDFNCFPFSRIAMIWYAKKFDERQENGARKREKLDLSFEKKK